MGDWQIVKQLLTATFDGILAFGVLALTWVSSVTFDGTTHVLFEPLDFIAVLAALVPEPRVGLTRYHARARSLGRNGAALRPRMESRARSA